jgi:hypothetical protein
MDVKQYCNDRGAELSIWKKELHDVLNTVETLPARDKELASPQIAGLRTLIEDINVKIEKLKNECPLDWNAMASEIQRSATELRRKMASIGDP